MSARMLTMLSGLRPTALFVVAALIIGAVMLEAWMLVVRKPLAEYQQVALTRQSLAAMAAMTVAQQVELQRASARAKQLADRLSAELYLPAPEEQLTVSLIRQLDQAAAQAGITLTSVKPAGRRPVLSFDELSFDVGAQGKYLPLCEWLLDFERTLGKSATVTEFTMRSADEGRQVALSLKLAVYRPLAPKGTEK